MFGTIDFVLSIKPCIALKPVSLNVESKTQKPRTIKGQSTREKVGISQYASLSQS